MDFLYVVYSHSSFSDVFKVQNQYFKEIKHEKILFIDILDETIDYNFDRIIFYNPDLNYSKRLSECLRQMNTDKYVIFIHDNDILLKHCEKDIYHLTNIMTEYSIDRIDLQHKIDNHENIHKIQYNNEIQLCQHKNASGYNYNVNPSIYRFHKLKAIMDTFDCSYRAIEWYESGVQEYCVNNLNTYTLYSSKPICAGYFNVTDIFIFLHITHHGELLPQENEKIRSMNEFVQNEYNDIIDKYSFNRVFTQSYI